MIRVLVNSLPICIVVSFFVVNNDSFCRYRFVKHVNFFRKGFQEKIKSSIGFHKITQLNTSNALINAECTRCSLLIT